MSAKPAKVSADPQAAVDPEDPRTLRRRKAFRAAVTQQLRAASPVNRGGSRHCRFVTVVPRTRLEVAEFRKWIQAKTPSWGRLYIHPITALMTVRATDGRFFGLA